MAFIIYSPWFDSVTIWFESQFECHQTFGADMGIVNSRLQINAMAREKTTPKASAKVVKPKAAPRPRATKYTPEIVDEIVERLSKGEPLRQICRDEHMPSWDAVYDWEKKYPDLRQRIACARERGEDAIAQECLEIADKATNDWMEANGQDDVGYKLNGEHIQRSKLRIETRLKLLAKWNPRKWGEKVDLNHGVQPDNPLATLLQQIQGTPMKPGGGK